MQERQSPNSQPRPSLRKPHPQDRTLQVSHTEPQGPDILPLPEHLQFNRKQRSDSPVAEFQLSLEGAE